jgi:hypothetical protein
VVANDGLGNSGEDVSETVLEICDALQTVYDFSINGGVDRWAWGSGAAGWAELDGARHPASVSTPLYTLDRQVYDRLAASDATGGDNDMNRYRSAAPAWPNHSTHLFEFTIHEDQTLIKDIGIRWEGYNDNCIHVEVYVWDDYGGNWSNGSGKLGENMYMANYAGNRDDMLEGHIRSDFSHYIDNDGKLALLLFCEIPTLKSFHDYIGVTVTHDYPLKTDLSTLSESTGGTVNFTLMAGEDNASRNYILLGSASGTEPGIPLPGGMVTLPLVWDQFTDLVLAMGNTLVFQQFRGSLDSMGQSTATLDSGGALPPGLVGLKLYFAYTLYSPPWNYCDFVSNPVMIEIVP